MSDKSNENSKNSIDRTKAEHISKLQQIKSTTERNAYLQSVVDQIMQEEFDKIQKKSAKHTRTKLDTNPSANLGPDTRQGVKNELVKALISLDNEITNTKKRDEAIAHAMNNAKNRVLTGRNDKQDFFNKRVEDKIKAVTSAYGQVQHQTPAKPKSPVLLSNSAKSTTPKNKDATESHHKVKEKNQSKKVTKIPSKDQTELESSVNQLIKECKGIEQKYKKMHHKNEKKQRISGVVNAFRNTFSNEKVRSKQIIKLESALTQASNLMRSNEPDKATKALHVIEKATQDIRKEIKAEHPMVRSRLDKIAKEISHKATKLQPEMKKLGHG